ncbi:hypothetical protein Tco_0567677 [Tanacetum coccineum]
MAEQQTITCDHQWNNMTVDDVVFQTNNVVGNFNYPLNMPAYKPIIKFLLNYPLNKAFTNCPSVVYQNFLKEFWSTVVAFDPFPSTDEPEKRPLREFLIKFSVLNGQRPLTLDFKTFCSTTGLDYNNGKYVAHPTPEVVKKELGKIAINPSYLDKNLVLKNSFPVAWRIMFTFVIQVLGGNYSSTKQVNSIQQLLAFSLITGTEVDIGEIIYSDLVTKLLNKSRLKYVSYPRFISCALQVLLGSDYTQDKKFGFLPPILSNSNFTKDPSKVTNIDLTSHMIAGPKASGALSKKRKQPKSKKPPTETKVTPPKPTEGSEQSYSVSSGIVPDPQDLERDIQLASTRLPSTLDEGTRKELPRLLMKARLNPCHVLKGHLTTKTSGGNIPPADMEPIHTPVADPSGTGPKYQVDETQSTRLRYQSLTKNKGKTSSEVEPDTEPLKLQTYANIQAFLLSDDELDKENDKEEVLAAGDGIDEDPQDDVEVKTPSPGPTQPDPSHMSRVLFNRITEKQSEQHEEAAVSYADLKASIDQYYNENITHRDQIDKLVEASMSSLDRSSTTISDLYKGLDVSTQLLKDINNVVKDDPTTNQKLNEATETFTRISSKLTENLGSRVTAVEISQTSLKSKVSSLRQDTSEIKSMMVEIYQAFKVQPSSTPSGSVTLTLALTHIPANVKWENATTTATEEPPSHTEGGIETQPRENSYNNPFPMKANQLMINQSPQLVLASTIIRPDPDEPVKVEFMINGKTIYITEQEIQEYLDKEEKMKKAVEENASAKAGEKFKKAQDAEHEVLKREHYKKVKRLTELNRRRAEEYMRNMTNRIMPEPITNVRIHLNTKPIVASVFKNNDKKNFDFHQAFRFSYFGITELDELGPIIQKKKNSVVKDLMTSLSQRYERLKKIPKELGIQSALPAPVLEQASSQTSIRKRKHMELEPEVKVPGLECNRSLPEEVPFVNYMVIEETKYRIFFIDVFSDQAFQRWDDIHKVGIDSLVSYLVMASMVKTKENARFSLKLRKMIVDHPDQDKLKSKKVKLEALGYHVE